MERNDDDDQNDYSAKRLPPHRDERSGLPRPQAWREHDPQEVDTHEVTLVDREQRTYLCGALPLLIVGERETMKVSRSLGSLASRGIEFVRAEVDEIDVGSKTVSTSAGRLQYDYLVVAAGARYSWSDLPGAADAYSFYDIESARRLRRRLRRATATACAVIW